MNLVRCSRCGFLFSNELVTACPACREIYPRAEITHLVHDSEKLRASEIFKRIATVQPKDLPMIVEVGCESFKITTENYLAFGNGMLAAIEMCERERVQ